MSQFKPSASVFWECSGNTHLFRNLDVGGSSSSRQREYPTYRALKKDMRRLMKEFDTREVHVSRSRRGEWGEWFEVWILSGGKLEITKEGWM